MKGEFQVDDKLFRKHQANLLKRLGTDFPTEVKREAGFFARDLSFFTAPIDGVGGNKARGFGTTAHKKAGEKAIATDLSRSVETITANWDNPAIAKRIRKYIARRNTRALEQMFKVLGVSHHQENRVVRFDKSVHEKNRNSRGRVGISVEQVSAFPKREIDRYRRSLYRRVGRAKAGWAKHAAPLGVMKSAPKWISRHFGTVSGGGAVGGTKLSPEVTFSNREPGASSVRSRLVFLKDVRKKAMVKRLRILFKSAVKKSNLS